MDDENENDSCNICLEEATCCCCGDIISHFMELNGYLRSLGLLQYIASPSVAAVVYNQVCILSQYWLSAKVKCFYGGIEHVHLYCEK